MSKSSGSKLVADINKYFDQNDNKHAHAGEVIVNISDKARMIAYFKTDHIGKASIMRYIADISNGLGINKTTAIRTAFLLGLEVFRAIIEDKNLNKKVLSDYDFRTKAMLNRTKAKDIQFMKNNLTEDDFNEWCKSQDITPDEHLHVLDLSQLTANPIKQWIMENYNEKLVLKTKDAVEDAIENRVILDTPKDVRNLKTQISLAGVSSGKRGVWDFGNVKSEYFD